MKPRVTIRYCPQCRWLLRSAWMAQEILQSFEADVGEVALVPSPGGVFQIHIDEVLIWDRKLDAGFPEVAELKRRVRDRVAPGRDLGHTDRGRSGGSASPGGPPADN